MSWPEPQSRPPTRRRVAAGLGLLLAGLLPGCGYRPLYGSNATASAVPEFAAIAVEQPEDRTAQILRNHLLDMLTPLGAPERPLYRLQIKVQESVSSVLVTRADEITRSNLSMSASVSLYDYRSGTSLYSVAISSITSFNVLRSDYANLVGEKDARARAAQDIAEQIRIRLGNYFTRTRRQQSVQDR